MFDGKYTITEWQINNQSVLVLQPLAEASTILHTTWNEHHFSVGIDGLYQRLETDRLETGKANRTRGGVFGQSTLSWRACTAAALFVDAA